MRIGLIVYGKLEKITGGNIYDQNLVKMFNEFGHHVTVISIPPSSYPISLSHNFSPDIYRRLREAKSDILLQDELVHPSFFLSNYKIRKRINLPIISIVHALKIHLTDSNLFKPWIQIIEKIYLRNVDGYVSISNRTLKQVVNFSGLRKPSVIALPAGDRFDGSYNKNQIKERCHQDGPLQILYIGNVTPNKQLHFLIKSLRYLSGKEYRLTVLGSLKNNPNYVTYIHHLINRYELPESIELVGNVTDEETLANYLRNSHVLALISKTEGLPLVYLEAANFGVPSLATSHSAADEFIEHGVNGLLINPDSYMNVVPHLKRLHTDRDYLEILSLNALQSFKSHPDWHDTANKIFQFLKTFT